MSEKTASDWAGYIAAAIKAAEDDGFYVSLDLDGCGSGCCTCSTDDITLDVSKYDVTTRKNDYAEVGW